MDMGDSEVTPMMHANEPQCTSARIACATFFRAFNVSSPSWCAANTGWSGRCDRNMLRLELVAVRWLPACFVSSPPMERVSLAVGDVGDPSPSRCRSCSSSCSVADITAGCDGSNSWLSRDILFRLLWDSVGANFAELATRRGVLNVVSSPLVSSALASPLEEKSLLAVLPDGVRSGDPWKSAATTAAAPSALARGLVAFGAGLSTQPGNAGFGAAPAPAPPAPPSCPMRAANRS